MNEVAPLRSYSECTVLYVRIVTSIPTKTYGWCGWWLLSPVSFVKLALDSGWLHDINWYVMPHWWTHQSPNTDLIEARVKNYIKYLEYTRKHVGMPVGLPPYTYTQCRERHYRVWKHAEQLCIKESSIMKCQHSVPRVWCGPIGLMCLLLWA